MSDLDKFEELEHSNADQREDEMDLTETETETAGDDSDAGGSGADSVDNHPDEMGIEPDGGDTHTDETDAGAAGEDAELDETVQAGETVEAKSQDRESKPVKKKRYQGYDVEKISSRTHKANRPWFWKVLGISLLLSIIIISAACTYLIIGDRKKTDYLTGMNEDNTMTALLEGHKNVTITESYSHLTDEKDYILTRLVSKTKSGDYYSYLKKEQGEDVIKEVIRKRKIYRYDETYPRFVALLGDNYEKICVPEIEGCVYQNNGRESIEDEKDKGTLINIKAVCNVQDGDEYSTLYGFDAGSKIEKNIVMDKDTGIVTSETEKCGEVEFYSYSVEYDGETKIPRFYESIEDTKDSRECMVYMDYGTEASKVYTYDVPYDVYFTVMDQEGYKCYTDEECTKEFSEYQIQIENPEGPVILYLKKE